MKLRFHLLLIGIFVFAPFLGGCTSRRAVQIPQEYQSPRPESPERPRPRNEAKDAARAPEAVQGPLVKPSPQFRESDISAAPASPPPSQGVKKPEDPPQRLASMNRVNQAKAALAEGKPDRAIPLLEQAVQVDVYNGEAFLQLARAWRMKKSPKKALEFARKAEILLQDQRGKLKEVYLLQSELYREAGDVKKSQSTQQKAQSMR